MEPRTLKRRWRSRRGATPTLAAVFLVAMTVTVGTVLWGFRPQTPAASPRIWYETVSPAPTQAYADGSDCMNVAIGGNTTQVCQPLQAIIVVVTSLEAAGLPLSKLQLYFLCNGTVYLSGTLASMEWIPGNTGTIGGGGNSGIPSLQTCGSYTPPTAAFNRFMFFDQLTPGDPNLAVGDQIVIFDQGFSPTFCAFAPSTLHVCWITSAEKATVQANSGHIPSTCPNPSYGGGENPASNGLYGLNGCDDDYHGVPDPACYTVPGACELYLAYEGSPASVVLEISMVGLLGSATG